MIKIPEKLADEILEYAKKGAPEEICGIIAGIESGAGRDVKEVYFLENTAHSASRFAVNPAEQLTAVRALRKKGLSPLGIIHSHPASPAKPSAEDMRLAYDTEASYMIISLMNGGSVLKSFRIRRGVFEEERVVTVRT